MIGTAQESVCTCNYNITLDHYIILCKSAGYLHCSMWVGVAHRPTWYVHVHVVSHMTKGMQKKRKCAVASVDSWRVVAHMSVSYVTTRNALTIKTDIMSCSRSAWIITLRNIHQAKSVTFSAMVQSNGVTWYIVSHVTECLQKSWRV